jgi:hypothetical protein
VKKIARKTPENAKAETIATAVNELQVKAKPGEVTAAAMARTALRPSIRAAETWHAYSPTLRNTVDLVAAVDEIAAQARAVQAGDMSRPEGMLVAQAHALDAVFNNLAALAKRNLEPHFDAAERLLRLALKAQSQCRATLESLAVIKYPPAPVAFVKQANIAQGHQQVINGAAPSRAESANRPNELLEHQDGERLERSAASVAGAADPQMVSVGAVDGSTHPRGEEKG